jgi:D-arabinonate dehydratase/D-galactarolactone cycloisomerase
MRIVDVEALVLSGKLDSGYRGISAYSGRFVEPAASEEEVSRNYPLRWRIIHPWMESITTCLIRVITDDGVVGIGESKGVIAPAAVKAYINDFLKFAVIGRDPLQTRVLWDRMYAYMRTRGHLQGVHQEAAAGIDIALWDIAGKSTGMAISELLGGRYRDQVRVYYSALGAIASDTDAEGVVLLEEETRAAVARGFNALKIIGGVSKKLDLRSVEIVREIVGQEFLVLFDAQGAYDYSQALWLAGALEDLGVGWFEAPLAPEDFEGLIRLSQLSRIPIANDLVWTTAIYKEILRQGGRVIVQPEVIKVGITESARLAELADIFGCAYAPHVSIGSAIQFAATAQVSAAAPNFLISEYWAGQNRLGDAILKSPLLLNDGALTVPNLPGLGIELDDAAVDAATLLS